MGDKYLLDANGNPVPEPDLMKWAAAFEAMGAIGRRVAVDQVGPFKVSTVFLGIDHAFGDGPPILFETMVFGPYEGEEMERYHTRAEALAGHVAMVGKVRGWLS